MKEYVFYDSESNTILIKCLPRFCEIFMYFDSVFILEIEGIEVSYIGEL